MTTVAQVRRAVQPLIQRNQDLESIGRFIFIKPVEHIWRGVYLESSRDPNEFVPHTAVGLLIPARSTVDLGTGQQLFKSVYGPIDFGKPQWDVSRPETVTRMLEMIEDEALPQLRPIQTFSDYMAFVYRSYSWVDGPRRIPFNKILVYAAEGELDSCLREIEENEDSFAYISKIAPEFRQFLIKRDYIELARILHEWEAQSVKVFKLEKIWKPAPFPFE
ncbi:hypothetical protein HB779_09995 [Phyllobacterium sp. 628]|uniref:hypothetical protein n=1 Tax=Phyllobacterium sp. 628 TaxID=2718938 RepID=UPI0016626C39|nr:hypothetical protein [Phyllobacterium sp. 628]QND52205.1 hypothetical protein HB779_09995 [Phyllobacterium sp. 628]